MPLDTQNRSRSATHAPVIDDPATTTTTGRGPTDPAALADAGAAATGRTAASSGGSSIENFLRSLLGTNAGQVISGHISEDQLTKWGQSVANSVIGSLGTQLQAAMPQGGQAQAQINRLESSIITSDLQRKVREFLASPEGQQVASNLSEALNGSPAAVVTTLLLGAAYFVLANGSLPNINASQNLGGGFSVSESVDLGTIRDIALHSIGAKLNYRDGDFQASIGASLLSGSSAASAAGGGRSSAGGTARVTAPGLAPEHVEALTASIQDKIGNVSLRATNTTNFANGQILNGTAGFNLSAPLAGGTVTAGVTDRYAGPNTGVSGTVAYTADFAHGQGAVRFNGTVDQHGQWTMGVAAVFHF